MYLKGIFIWHKHKVMRLKMYQENVCLHFKYGYCKYKTIRHCALICKNKFIHSCYLTTFPSVSSNTKQSLSTYSLSYRITHLRFGARLLTYWNICNENDLVQWFFETSFTHISHVFKKFISMLSSFSWQILWDIDVGWLK